MRKYRLMGAWKCRLGLLWLSAGLGALGQTGSREALVELEPLTVTGSRLPVVTGGRASTVDGTVTTDALAEGYATFGELLNDTAGVYYNEAPGGAASTEVWLRGAETNFALITIDGVKVNDVLDDRGGTFDPGILSPALVATVAVLRGPGSALIGSGALSGVIAIESLPLRPRTGGLLRLELAPEGNGAVDIRADAEAATWLLHADAGRRELEWPEGQGGRLTEQLGLGAGGRIGESLEVQVSARRIWRESRAFPADSGGLRHAVIRELEESDTEASIGSIRLRQRLANGSRWRMKLYGFAQDTSLESPGVAPGTRDPAGVPATTTESAFRRFGISSDYSWSTSERWDFAIGAEIEQEEGDSDSVYDFGGFRMPASHSIARTTYSLAGEARLRTENWVLAYAARGDDAEEHGLELSQQFRADWLAGLDGLALGVSLQNGFKYPSLYALSNAFVGNPELVSEEVSSLAAHLRLAQAGRPWLLEATVFASAYRDLIDFDAGPPPQLVNRDKVRTKGFELRTEWQLGTLAASAYLSLAVTDLVGSEDALTDRPEWRGGMHVRWQLDAAWTAHLRGRYIGSMLDSSIPTGLRTLNERFVVDFLLSWRMREQSELWLRVENFLDTDFEHAIGSPGRGVVPSVVFTQYF